MARPWNPHIVQQGEHLTELAARAGVEPEAIWTDARNRELSERRGSGDLLLPGDVVHVPDEPAPGAPVAAGAKNRYIAMVPTVSIEVCLLRGDDPLRNRSFLVEGASGLDGTTDGDGMAALAVPLHVRELCIVVPDEGLRYPLRVGALDPIDEPSGVQMRLENLGFWRANSDDPLADAAARFQEARGLLVTRVIDGNTRDELVRAYGC